MDSGDAGEEPINEKQDMQVLNELRETEVDDGLDNCERRI